LEFEGNLVNENLFCEREDICYKLSAKIYRAIKTSNDKGYKEAQEKYFKCCDCLRDYQENVGGLKKYKCSLAKDKIDNYLLWYIFYNYRIIYKKVDPIFAKQSNYKNELLKRLNLKSKEIVFEEKAITISGRTYLMSKTAHDCMVKIFQISCQGENRYATNYDIFGDPQIIDERGNQRKVTHDGQITKIFERINYKNKFKKSEQIQNHLESKRLKSYNQSGWRFKNI